MLLFLNTIIAGRLHYSDVYSSDPEDENLSATTIIPQINDYVVVKFAGKKSIKHYIGLVLSKDGNEFSLKYMRRVTGNKFIFPTIDDISVVDQSDIVFILKQPDLNNRNYYVFTTDLDNISNLS